MASLNRILAREIKDRQPFCPFSQRILLRFVDMTSREILKDIEDIQGDRRSGALTIPIKLGVKRARTVSTILILPAIPLVFLPWILKKMDRPYLGLIILATMALIFSFFLQPRKSQKVIKLATMIVVTAFLMGSF